MRHIRVVGEFYFYLFVTGSHRVFFDPYGFFFPQPVRCNILLNIIFACRGGSIFKIAILFDIFFFSPPVPSG